MGDDKTRLTSRRRLLKTVGTASILAGMAPGIFPRKVNAQKKTLRIMRWKNFVPGLTIHLLKNGASKIIHKL
jgi:hypothetical protein